LPSILQLVAEPASAAQLNAACTLPLLDTFRPLPSSYFDPALAISVHICEAEGAWPFVARLFHAAAPWISVVSLPTVLLVVALFERALETDSEMMALFLDGFASIVQRTLPTTNGFLVALSLRKSLVREPFCCSSDS
jgi:hypothetical protein